MAATAMQVDEPVPVTPPQTIPAPLESSNSDEESHDEDDGLALLPRHTKVLVVGNNRTKQSLVGVAGIVKKAVGLGGWHWLVLSSGEEVRLQRNALSVVEAPTGLESDFSDLEDASPSAQATEALPKVRSRRPPRPLAHSPELPHQRRLSVRHGSGQPRVNFNKLDANALKRYRRFYKLADVGPNSSKEQLAYAVGKHFMSQTVDENKVIAMFVAAARRSAASLATPV